MLRPVQVQLEMFLCRAQYFFGEKISLRFFSPFLLHRIVMFLAVFLKKLLVVAWWFGILGIWLDDILGSSSAEEDPVEISWSGEELSLRLMAPHSRPSWPSITELQNRMTWTESPWAEHQRVSGHHLVVERPERLQLPWIQRCWHIWWHHWW